MKYVQETFNLYSAASKVNSFYHKGAPLTNVVLIGRESGAQPDYYFPIATDNIKYITFGYYDNMDKMTQTGKDFFVNLVYFAGNLTL